MTESGTPRVDKRNSGRLTNGQFRNTTDTIFPPQSAAQSKLFVRVWDGFGNRRVLLSVTRGNLGVIEPSTKFAYKSKLLTKVSKKKSQVVVKLVEYVLACFKLSKLKSET